MQNYDEEYDFENNDETNDSYDRSRSIAVLTGIVCMLVSMAGTVLGSFHAINTIGTLAGILATSCYAIADLVVYWAARIDYKEDGNAMEWTAWGVKYGLSLILLFIGGCVAYMLFSSGDLNATREATTKRAQAAYNACIAGKSRQSICQKQYDSIMKNETQATANLIKGKTEENQWIEKLVNHPLFNYASGVFGIFGLIALSFVSKFMPKKNKAKRRIQRSITSKQSAKVLPIRVQAPFRTTPKTVYKSISNGKQSFRLRRQSGRGVLVRVSWRNGKREIDCGSIKPELAEVMQYQSYDQFAKEIIPMMNAKGLNAVEIENSLQ